jgi:hypothetical protein
MTVPVVACVCNENTVYATLMPKSDLYKLSIMRGVRTCYEKYAKDSIELGWFSDYKSIFNTGDGWDKTTSDDVWITTHVGNNLYSGSNISDSDLSCEQVFEGYKEYAKGFKNYYAFPNSLEGYGYRFDHNEGQAGEDSGTANADYDQVTISVDSITDASGEDGTPVVVSGEIVCDGEQKEQSGEWGWRVTRCSGGLRIDYGYEDNKKWLLSIDSYGGPIDEYSINNFTVSVGDIPTNRIDWMSWGQFLSTRIVYLKGGASRISFAEAFARSEFINGSEGSVNSGQEGLKNYLIMSLWDRYMDPDVRLSIRTTTPTSGDDGNIHSVWVPISSKSTAGEIMLYNVGFDNNLPYSETSIESNGDKISFKTYRWSNYAEYSLYYYYLMDMISQYPDIKIDENSCISEKPDEWRWAVKIAPDKWCRINVPASVSFEGTGSDVYSVVYGLDLDQGYFENVLDWLSREDSYDGLNEDQYSNSVMPSGVDDSDGDDNNAETPACYSYSGSLGWILCTVLDFMKDVAQDAYDDYVEPALSVDPKLFTEGDEGLREAWGVFQTIANILFILLFMVVIFSQLTGVGIDNYGIKKILPKLIVAAILVNLSYWICIACVDLSNIVGNGIQNLFENLPAGTPVSEIGGVNIDGATVGGGLVSVGLLVALGVGGWAIISNPAILLALLVSALGVVVSVFFLFVLLSAREAAIVVLVVISPVAFVCYMLPNTKKLFSKFLKIGEGLLLVYPIAGLLVGGGGYVSKLLLTSGFASRGFFAAFTAMIVGIIPIFFIPSVLKGSFAAMGNIGAKISGVGQRLRGGADRRMRNSNVYKNAQESGMMRRTRLRAGIGRDGKETNKAWGKAMRALGGKRNMARARSQYLKDQDTKSRMDSLMGVGFTAAAIGQQKKAEKDEMADYMTLINNDTRNGEDTETLYAMFNKYMREKNKAGAAAVARIAGRRKDTAADFMNKMITGYDPRTGNISNVAAGYDAKILSSVMKEIATGENSGMYRQSGPLGFEFAAQYNKNYKEENGVPVDGAVNANYSTWRSAVNVDRAVGNYVTNAQELVGMKGSSLSELNRLMNTDGAMSVEERARIQHLADSVIANRNKPGAPWDSTKAKELAGLSGSYTYNERDGIVEMEPAGGTRGGTPEADGGRTPTGTGSFDIPRGAAGGTEGGTGGGNSVGNPGYDSHIDPRSGVDQNIGGGAGSDGVSE